MNGGEKTGKQEIKFLKKTGITGRIYKKQEKKQEENRKSEKMPFF